MIPHFLLDVRFTFYCDEGCIYLHMSMLTLWVLFLGIGELRYFYVFDACLFLKNKMSAAYFMLSNPSSIVSLHKTHNLLE